MHADKNSVGFGETNGQVVNRVATSAVTPLSVSDPAASVNGAQDLSTGPLLGRVSRVEQHRLEIEVSDRGLADLVTVADLVAVPTHNRCLLIGVVEGVTERPGWPQIQAGEEVNPGRCHVELRVMPVGTFGPQEPGEPDGFTRGTSSYPHVGGSCHLIEGQNLESFTATVSSGVGPRERLVLGRYIADHEASAVADGNRLFQRHVALLGSTGTGKSWAIAHVLECASHLKYANLVVLDVHGEYDSLTRGPRPLAHGFRVAGPADLGRASDDLLYLPYWLLQRDELLTLVLNPADPHAPDQVLRLTEQIQTLKHVSLLDAGRGDAEKTFTIDSPIPYHLNHLITALKSDDIERVVRHPSTRPEPGPYAGRLTGLITRLEARAADPRYGFIFNPPDDTLAYPWLSEAVTKLLLAGGEGAGIKIVNLSEVPSAILPTVAGVLARLVYDVQFWTNPERRAPVALVCDEAHLYLPARDHAGSAHRTALETYESIAKEGRKYGVSLLVASQRPSDISGTILSQCNNFIIMRLSNDHDRAAIERLVPEALSSTTGIIPALDVGEAVLIGDALPLPTRIKFDPPAIKPVSATQPYWSLWAERPSSSDAIAAGVEALRNRLRANE